VVSVKAYVNQFLSLQNAMCSQSAYLCLTSVSKGDNIGKCTVGRKVEGNVETVEY